MSHKNPIKQLLHATFSFAIKERSWRKLIFAASLVLTIVVLYLNYSSLKQGAIALAEGNWPLISLSLFAIAVTYFTAAGVYWSLADRKIEYLQMVQVELAGAFTSRLLPAGLGGVATNIKYISGVMHSKTQATAIVALNNLLSFLSYILAAFLLIVFTHEPIKLVNIHLSSAWIIFLLVGVVLLILLASLVKQIRQKAEESLAKLLHLLQAYKKRPQLVLFGLLSALGTTTFYLVAFYLCTKGLGEQITLAQAFIAFTFGLTGGTVSPTPGGIGGAELGFYSGLYATGIASTNALSIVLVYRLLAFWLPLIPGFFMFRYLIAKKIL